MDETEKKVFRTIGSTIEVVHLSDITDDDAWCLMCQCYVRRADMNRWTGDDALHYLCPGCDSDLLPVESLE